MPYICPYCGEDNYEPFNHCGESSAHNVYLNDEQFKRLVDGKELEDLMNEVKK